MTRPNQPRRPDLEVGSCPASGSDVSRADVADHTVLESQAQLMVADAQLMVADDLDACDGDDLAGEDVVSGCSHGFNLAQRIDRIQRLSAGGELPIGVQLVGVQHDPGLYEAQLSLRELPGDELARQVKRGFVLSVLGMEVRQRVMRLWEGGASIFLDRDSVEAADTRHLGPLVVREWGSQEATHRMRRESKSARSQTQNPCKGTQKLSAPTTPRKRATA